MNLPIALVSDFSEVESASESGLQRTKSYLLHSGLFFLTFLTTALAGVQWLNKNFLELNNFPDGIPYALLILFMLASHEFGHYTAARLHHVKATLPYFIPFPSFFGLIIPFGTLGAVIKLQSPVPSRKVLFDIGAAGPIAGFVASMIILAVGFRTLPSIDYLYSIHPEYAQMSSIPETGLTFGRTLFFSLFAWLFAPAGAFIPPMNEIYHYPFLCVGWFGMLVTAMNLLPIGQLDGGHISYAMFGRRYHVIAQTALIFLIVAGTAGFLPLFNIPFAYGWTGWLFWALILAFFMRRYALNRPPVPDETPLDGVRVALGWLSILILIGSFSLTPFTLELP
jgi:membrane-associated protease RseP (regulator of RpoE activity)